MAERSDIDSLSSQVPNIDDWEDAADAVSLVSLSHPTLFDDIFVLQPLPPGSELGGSSDISYYSEDIVIEVRPRVFDIARACSDDVSRVQRRTLMMTVHSTLKAKPNNQT